MNPILLLLKNSPDQAYAFSVQQVVSICSDGRLQDKSACSLEFREYLRIAPSHKLADYVGQCLLGFERSGFVLQDLVNELGRRLDYNVENGLYQGKPNTSGHDGIWHGKEGHSLIIEVKTSDAYRMNLDKIAAYRERLIASSTVSENSSLLLVVGRDDTGDLEAQVRGSRHAWTVRIVSIDALIRLVALKERTDQSTVDKIHELLVPFEYTRLDRIIDIAFTVAEDTTLLVEEEAQGIEETDSTIPSDRKQEHTPRELLAALRERIALSLGMRESIPLVKKGSVSYWNPDVNVRAVISVSKHYKRGTYWYAYQPKWHFFLGEGKKSFYVLSCLDRNEAYAIPFEWIDARLPDLYKTENDSRMYWHVHLEELETGKLVFQNLKQSKKEDISQFRLVL